MLVSWRMHTAPAPCARFLQLLHLLLLLVLLPLLLLCRLSQLGLWRQWQHTVMSLAQCCAALQMLLLMLLPVGRHMRRRDRGCHADAAQGLPQGRR